MATQPKDTASVHALQNPGGTGGGTSRFSPCLGAGSRPPEREGANTGRPVSKNICRKTGMEMFIMKVMEAGLNGKGPNAGGKC